MTANPIGPLQSSLYFQDILETPEHPELHRLTSLVEEIFRVPVAYMALWGSTEEAAVRIGTGAEYGPGLKNLSLHKAVDEPRFLADLQVLPEGADAGALRFAASAALRSSSGIYLGVLVIADHVPRPDFSARDARILADLAGVLAGKLELRMVASLALEAERSLRASEHHFRDIADYAPAMLLYFAADGGCRFANRAWLEFTGRSAAQEMESGWADSIHSAYRGQVLETCWLALRQRHPFSAEAPFRRRDGDYRWLAANGSPRFRDDGSFAGCVGCFRDLTEWLSAGADAAATAPAGPPPSI